MEIVGASAQPLGVIPAAAMESRAEGVLEGVTCGLRARPGETPQLNGCHGLPVMAALERVHVGPFGFLTVPRPNGTIAYLPARDFTEPATVFEGTTPPLFSIDQSSTRFWRPPLRGDPSDANAADNIATVSGEALVVGVHGGSIVTVAALSSSSSATAGTAVQFEAGASGGLPGETFTYDWSFGDGTGATGESVSHAFAGTGTYEVRVTAVGSEESGGESDPIDIVVGDPPTTESPGATTTPEPQATSPAGAPGKGARAGRGGTGKKPGPAAGKRAKGNESSPQRGRSPADRSPGHESAAPTASPTAPPQLPSAAPPPAGPSGGDAAELPGCCSAAPSPAGSPRPSPPRAEPTPSPGELVEGRLVGDELGPMAAAEAGGGSAPGQGSRAAAGAVGSGGSGVPAVALMVVVLLAGGALFEWHRGRPTG